MTTPFATLAELQDRLDFTMTEDEQRMAEAALEDASDMARGYGRDWTDAAHAPRMVRTLVLRAVSRFMKNPDGYVQSRAGDETLIYNDDKSGESGSVTFSDDEIKLLRELAGRTTTLASVAMTSWGKQRRYYDGYGQVRTNEGFRPVDQGKPFPMFSSERDPW